MSAFSFFASLLLAIPIATPTVFSQSVTTPSDTPDVTVASDTVTPRIPMALWISGGSGSHGGNIGVGLLIDFVSVELGSAGLGKSVPKRSIAYHPFDPSRHEVHSFTSYGWTVEFAMHLRFTNAVAVFGGMGMGHRRIETLFSYGRTGGGYFINSNSPSPENATVLSVVAGAQFHIADRYILGGGFSSFRGGFARLGVSF